MHDMSAKTEKLKPFYQDEAVTFYPGDCRSVLPCFTENLFDAVVTDPPYELGFMGKSWDSTGIAYNVDLWLEVYRVMKPGAHLLAFGGTRTYHRMACAIEDAGFEIRDQIQWLYGSGFPKSLDVSKAIDREAGAEREIIGRRPDHVLSNGWREREGRADRLPETSLNITTAATDEAKQWNGWGTALKPANEPICLARKPLEKGLTVAQNVLKWGTGALNIDACRIDAPKGNGVWGSSNKTVDADRTFVGSPDAAEYRTEQHPNGRWPANVIHDGSDEVLACFPETTSGSLELHHKRTGGKPPIGTFTIRDRTGEQEFIGDSGSAARFFYTAKASKHDRDAGLNGLPLREKITRNSYGDQSEYECPDGASRVGNKGTSLARNNHPTVKPVELMKYLCRLVTPPGGLILDPFLGSGSTAKAALIERFKIVGIELNLEYLEIAKARLNELQVGLF